MADTSTAQPRISAASTEAREELSRRLRRDIRGEVRFSDGDRALYATDSSNYRQVPLGVVIPADVDDLSAVVAACRDFDAPILTRGGGTSLAGQTCNVAVVIDVSKHLHGLHSFDVKARRAHVEPGLVLDRLQDALKPHGLRFGPDPSTHDNCTLGGMIGNNACGAHSLQCEFAGMGGRTSDNVSALDVLTYDGLRMRVGTTSDTELDAHIASGGRRGEIYARLKALRDRYAPLIRERFPKIPRRVSGYNLDDLLPEKGFNVARALAGTEGTCVLYTGAELELIPHPAHKVLVVLGYKDIYTAADHVPEWRQFQPDALEGFDIKLMRKLRKKTHLLDAVKLYPEGDGWLLAEFGGATHEEAMAKARRLEAHARKLSVKNGPTCSFHDDPVEQALIWRARESGLGVTAHVPGEHDAWEGWEDSAVAPERLGDFLRGLRALFDKYGYDGPLYGHFGQGLVHTRITFDLRTPGGVEQFRDFTRQAADLVVRMGGSLSGEHGDGQSRAEWLERMYGPELIQAFRDFKAIWDPLNRMNPHKVVEPYRVDDNLRMGPTHNPRHPETHFKFPHDKGSFAYALERCVGVGKCRKTESGTMCPSYMATREEMHSTRGRTHLLFELMNADVIGRDGGWRDESVREALSLCLACKGCKAECPVNVDMATYKAEFLSHYYEGRLRPMPAYTMGLIYWWARAASLAPGLVNYFTQNDPWARWLKKLGGIAPERQMPSFAQETARAWFRKRGGPRGNGKRILFWPDTFNNYLKSDTAKAAIEVLERLGYRVELPPRTLCCGRPLYDWGMLSTARRLLVQVMDSLEAEIRDGTPIVGIEPSCVATFRDELPNLFPDDERAQKLSKQVVLLGEFLMHEKVELPRLGGKALVHIHCHHKSVLQHTTEAEVLKRLGLDFTSLDSGCCGMAGAFGFEAANYGVSVAVAERRLLPALREAEPGALLIANGFSCREQIQDLAGQETLHLADVIKKALDARK